MNLSKKSKTNIDELDKLIEEIVGKLKKINKSTNICRRFWQRIFKSAPRPEVYHDLLHVRAYAERVTESIRKCGTVDKERLHTLATILAYLELAERERDFAQAWTYVNLADELLPLVVEEHELESCCARLSAWDEGMPDNLKKKLKAALDYVDGKTDSSSPSTNFVESLKSKLKEKGIDLPKDAVIHTKEENQQSLTKDGSKTYFASKETDEIKVEGVPKVSSPASNVPRKYNMHIKQSIRASFWNSSNRRISLKLYLWHSIGFWLFLSLIFAILVSEYVYFNYYKPVEVEKAQSEQVSDQALKKVSQIPPFILSHPFFFVAVLGFFGGALSASLKARKSVIDITSYELIQVHTKLRMLLGAAGSFVVYILIQVISPGGIADTIHTNIFAFLGIGIAAGFSERLFVGTLEKISENINLTGVEEEGEGEGEKGGK